MRKIKHGNAILDPDDVSAIRRLLKSPKHTAAYLARLFGVSNQTITDIKYEKSWRHLK